MIHGAQGAADAPKRRKTILGEFSANRIIVRDDISPNWG